MRSDASAPVDWYARRDELMPDMVFIDRQGDRVMLDQRVEGDGSKWEVADWNVDHWSYDGGTIEPGDLVERIEA